MFTYYQAPNPYPRLKQDFLGGLFSGWLLSSGSETIGKLILPAQKDKPLIIGEADLQKIKLMFSVTIDYGFVETHDGASLDSVEIIPKKTENTPINQQRFIIKFNGNGGQYLKFMEEFAADANTIGATVIGFNYRGVAQSIKPPKVFQDLITDGIAQVQRLLYMGAKPENILLDGHSIGGAVATKVAHHFHQLGIHVYIWNDRSFSTLSKAAGGILAPSLPGMLHDTAQASIQMIASTSVMRPSGWEVDVATAYMSIPAPYKGYMVVHKDPGDEAISQRASLDESVKEHEKQQQRTTGYTVTVLPSLSLFRVRHTLNRKDLVLKDDPEQSGQTLFAKFADKLGGSSET